MALLDNGLRTTDDINIIFFGPKKTVRFLTRVIFEVRCVIDYGIVAACT